MSLPAGCSGTTHAPRRRSMMRTSMADSGSLPGHSSSVGCPGGGQGDAPLTRPCPRPRGCCPTRLLPWSSLAVRQERPQSAVPSAGRPVPAPRGTSSGEIGGPTSLAAFAPRGRLLIVGFARASSRGHNASSMFPIASTLMCTRPAPAASLRPPMHLACGAASAPSRAPSLTADALSAWGSVPALRRCERSARPPRGRRSARGRGLLARPQVLRPALRRVDSPRPVGTSQHGLGRRWIRPASAPRCPCFP